MANIRVIVKDSVDGPTLGPHGRFVKMRFERYVACAIIARIAHERASPVIKRIWPNESGSLSDGVRVNETPFVESGCEANVSP